VCIPAFWRGQEDHEFEDCLGYLERPYFIMKNKTKQNKKNQSQQFRHHLNVQPNIEIQKNYPQSKELI
jgi:hypothetical protein